MNREFLFKEYYRQYHDPDRRRIKKDRRGGHRHQSDRGEVAACKEQDAHKAQSQEQRDVFGAELKAFGIFYEQYEREKDPCRDQS